MDDMTAEMILLTYEEYESKFMKFLRMVPYSDSNKNTWSPLPADVLLSVCSLLDSMFREISSDPHQSSIRKRDRNCLNICDYKEQFATSLRLACARTLVFMTPPKMLCPFRVWQSGEQTSPDWWNSYNSVKHDRLRNIELATANATLNALCAMFTTAVSYPPMYPILLRRGWADVAGHNAEILLKELSLQSRWQAYSSGSKGNFVAYTRLFITTLGPKPLPDKPEDINPLDFLPADRLMTFWAREFDL